MDIREIRAGNLLMRQHDTGLHDLYAVLDGELAVRTKGGGNTNAFHTAKRGNLIGTLGRDPRTCVATVSALTDARLLCIKERDLDELHRRHPMIAARIYKNLGNARSQDATCDRGTLAPWVHRRQYQGPD